MKKRYILLILLGSIVANAEMTPEVMEIQKHWAEVNYLTNEDGKEKAFENLAKAASNLVLKQPQNPHALVWEGIVYSTYAGVAGTFPPENWQNMPNNRLKKPSKLMVMPLMVRLIPALEFCTTKFPVGH